ncbi:MAG: DUF1616 domain-containing protein [Chloroflexota bacterium]
MAFQHYMVAPVRTGMVRSVRLARAWRGLMVDQDRVDRLVQRYMEYAIGEATKAQRNRRQDAPPKKSMVSRVEARFGSQTLALALPLRDAALALVHSLVVRGHMSIARAIVGVAERIHYWPRTTPEARDALLRAVLVEPWLGAVAVASLLAAALAASGGPLVLRLPLGLLAVLLLPGYGLSVALFPGRDRLDGIGRVAFAFGSSLAMVIVLALGLNYTPWQLTYGALTASVTVVTLALSALGHWRTRHLRIDAKVRLRIPRTVLDGGPSRRAVLIVGAAGLLATLSLALTLAVPPAPYSEFYMVGEEGLAKDYPRAVEAGVTFGVDVGVANQERSPATYEIEVTAQGRTVANTPSIELAPNETWTGAVSFALSKVGKDQRVDLVLFKGEDRRPYRQLQLWVDVGPASGGEGR